MQRPSWEQREAALEQAAEVVAAVGPQVWPSRVAVEAEGPSEVWPLPVAAAVVARGQLPVSALWMIHRIRRTAHLLQSAFRKTDTSWARPLQPEAEERALRVSEEAEAAELQPQVWPAEAAAPGSVASKPSVAAAAQEPGVEPVCRPTPSSARRLALPRCLSAPVKIAPSRLEAE